MLSSIEFLRHILDEAKYIIHASQGLKKRGLKQMIP